ncbi:MAG: imidazole glycerol phosphate synthase subunit HisH [Bdellovibrionales bacterium]|nr:imidazole glycerol phosphate synthase subunit HisH [Bdellovibrionales bacterium]
MSIAIVDYNAGNILSVCNALQRLHCEFVVTNEPSVIGAARGVIFPGVGEAQSAMGNLRRLGLDTCLAQLNQPVLGICVGMQLLCAHSEEGDTDGIGVFSEAVKKFTLLKKVPHVGWNAVVDTRGPLFENIPEGSYFYFVHSFCADVGAHTIGSCDYEQTFSAALQRDNYYAVQFHPEKSGTVGASLLKNFVGLCQ